MPKGKKGQEGMTIGTIIVIVLALILLVVLVVGFTGGWSNLWGRISNFFGGGSNVDSIVQACQVACTTNQKYEWCDRGRKVTFGDTDLDKDKTKTYTCYQLANSIPKSVSLDSCNSVDCAAVTCESLETSECANTTANSQIVGCSVKWMTAQDFDAAKASTTATQNFADITVKVTAASDLSDHKNQVCAKITPK